MENMLVWHYVACVMITLRDAKQAPSDIWKELVFTKNIVIRESPENWYPSASSGHEKKDAVNLPATAN